jgi:hypothetical protein
MRADRTQDEDSLDLLRGQPAVQSRRGWTAGVGLAAAELLRITAVSAFAEEKEVEAEPVEHDGDPHQGFFYRPVSGNRRPPAVNRPGLPVTGR